LHYRQNAQSGYIDSLKSRFDIRLYLILLVPVFFAGFWLLGLALFAAHIRILNEPSIDARLEATDAIVVLAGGQRVSKGFELLEASKGRKLFISGVEPDLTLEQLLGHRPVAQDLRACCIILGHVARNTIENAEETRAWMTGANYHSLRLVTANVHMPRSELLFRAAMPGVTIVTYPIRQNGVELDNWWRHLGTSPMVREYDKYLQTIVGLYFHMI
jgi:uncharacterized SAM-binding protein YcdF (DUF218 family)